MTPRPDEIEHRVMMAPESGADETSEASRATMVLVVGKAGGRREGMCRALRAAGMKCKAVGSVASAARRLMNGRGEASVDVVIGDAGALGEDLRALADQALDAGACLVVVGAHVTMESAVEAMRLGAADILSHELDGAELAERVAAAAKRGECRRRDRRRIDKLKRICRRLNSARGQVERQVDALCTDLVGAYQELADHMNQVTTASEFKGLIQSELDIESLLRTTLEYVLSRSGPTNAAVFLPTTSGDYSLGAYVNYDCPKETVDILLDHLANVVAPRFEHVSGLVHLPEPEGLERYIGDDAQWLDGSGVAAMACRHNGETLAIMMLFRDRKNGYGTPLLEQVKTIGELFAAQLARVIHIHHRHLPKDKWGMLGDPEHGTDEGYGDLAA